MSALADNHLAQVCHREDDADILFYVRTIHRFHPHMRDVTFRHLFAVLYICHRCHPFRSPHLLDQICLRNKDLFLRTNLSYSDMSTPAVPPPQYTDARSQPKTYGAAEGLDASAQHSLLGHAGPSATRGNAWIDQPEDDDLPDDFKVGVNVSDCDVLIRMAFVRKIYS